MTESAIYLEQLQAVSEALHRELATTPETAIHARPGPGLNSVIWNYYHLLRIWDYDLNWAIKGQNPTEDAWHRGGFTDKSGYNPDGKGTDGFGLGSRYTDVDVDELNVIDPQILDEYHNHLLAETEEYLQQANSEELRRQVTIPYDPSQTATCAARIHHTIGSCWIHVGEMRYAKGVLGYHDPSYPQSETNPG